jgi:hypothetical protein
VARRQCTGDWCILLDCDEFIPEWEFGRIRDVLEHTRKDVLPLRYVHFYGNYQVVNVRPEKFGWPVRKATVHRNLDTMEVWGDGSNVRVRGSADYPVNEEVLCDCHHFGFVRNPARLRQKWRTQAKQHSPTNPTWDWMPGLLFDLMPHRWEDEDFLQHLERYDGPYVKAVRDNPDEFVRDQFRLLDILARRRCRGRASVPSRRVAQRPAAFSTGERASAAKVTTPRRRSGGMSRGQYHSPFFERRSQRRGMSTSMVTTFSMRPPWRLTVWHPAHAEQDGE